MAKADQAYPEPEIAAKLERDLPRWRYEGGFIRRSFKTHGWKGSLMVANTVGHLAEAAWHHPDMLLSYASVEVRLQTFESEIRTNL